MATVLLNGNNIWADIKKNTKFKDETKNCVIHDSVSGNTHFTKLTLSQKEKGHAQSGLKRAREWIIARRDEQIKLKFPNKQSISKTFGTRNELLFNIDHWEENKMNVITLVSQYTLDYSKRECGSFVIFSLGGGSESEVQTVREEIMKIIDRVPRVIHNKPETSTTNNTGHTTNQVRPEQSYGDGSADKKTSEPHSTSSIAHIDNAALTTNQIRPKTSSNNARQTTNQVRPKHSDGFADAITADPHLTGNNAPMNNPAQMTTNIIPKISNKNPDVTNRRVENACANNGSLKSGVAQSTSIDPSEVSQGNMDVTDGKGQTSIEPKHTVPSSSPAYNTDQIYGKAKLDKTVAQDTKSAENASSKMSVTNNKAVAAERDKSGKTQPHQNLQTEGKGNETLNTSSDEAPGSYTFLNAPISQSTYAKFLKTVHIQQLEENCGLNIDVEKCDPLGTQIKIKGLRVKNLLQPSMDALYKQFGEIFDNFIILGQQEEGADTNKTGKSPIYAFLNHTVNADKMKQDFGPRLKQFEQESGFKVQFTTTEPRGSVTSRVYIKGPENVSVKDSQNANDAFEKLLIDYKKTFPICAKIIKE